MPNTAIINDARIMSKGQVTIPKNIRSILGVMPGDCVTFVAEKGSVRVVNSVLYAMQQFQKDMQGQAEISEIKSEEDVAEWITQSRREESIR